MIGAIFHFPINFSIFHQFDIFRQFLISRQFLILRLFLILRQFPMFRQFLIFRLFLMFRQFLILRLFLMFRQCSISTLIFHFSINFPFLHRLRIFHNFHMRNSFLAHSIFSVFIPLHFLCRFKQKQNCFPHIALQLLANKYYSNSLPLSTSDIRIFNTFISHTARST